MSVEPRDGPVDKRFFFPQRTISDKWDIHLSRVRIKHHHSCIAERRDHPRLGVAPTARQAKR